jgi:hypothetical protein
VHPFILDLRERTYSRWKLRDITIVEAVPNLPLDNPNKDMKCWMWALMQFFADQIPSVKSFGGRGSMVHPAELDGTGQFIS